MENKKTTKTTEPEKKEQNKQVTISEDTLVKVKSGFYGLLHYKNLVTGEKITWEHQGDVQILPIRELRTMRSQQPGFFKNQWLIIAGVAEGERSKATPADICRHLAITEYYKNFIDPTNFDEACDWSETEIPERIALMTTGAKENLIIALNQFIKEGRLDSIRKIKAFEKALDCDLKWFN